VISTVAGNGDFGFSGDGGPATSAAFVYPIEVALDGAGNLYLNDAGNTRVRKVSTAGIISTVAGNGVEGFGGDGRPATSASLRNPVGLALDGSGNLYIADRGNHRIRKVSAGGVISTVAGNGGAGFGGDGGAATAAGLNVPFDVKADAGGELYIADLNNHRIRKVDVGGIISTFAGNGIAGYNGDGGPANSAQLNSP